MVCRAPVELAVTGSVEAVPDDHPRRCLDRGDAAEHRERRLGVDPPAVGPGGEDLPGDDRADPDLLEQPRRDQLDQRQELCFELRGFALARQCPLRGGA